MPDPPVRHREARRVRASSERQHFAVCTKDDCPWKYRGATAEAADEAARQHVVIDGHDVRRYEEQSWIVM